MKKITGWFAAFGLAAMLAAGTAGQAYAAPEETQAAAEAVQTEEGTAAAGAELMQPHKVGSIDQLPAARVCRVMGV